MAAGLVSVVVHHTGLITGSNEYWTERVVKCLGFESLQVARASYGVSSIDHCIKLHAAFCCTFRPYYQDLLSLAVRASLFYGSISYRGDEKRWLPRLLQVASNIISFHGLRLLHQFQACVQAIWRSVI
jgi:hypothetical protein